MLIRWLFAAAHLLALGIGLGAVWGRARALRGPLDAAGLSRVFVADTWWGAAAGLWIVTGLARAFAGLEKGGAYYLHSHWFFAKMALFAVILALEVWPMVALIRWRIAARQGGVIDTRSARAFSRISVAQAHLVALMVFAAVAMARGY